MTRALTVLCWMLFAILLLVAFGPKVDWRIDELGHQITGTR